MQYKRAYMKAAPGLYKEKDFKNYDPLFILRLHFFLKNEPDHMEIYNRLTEGTWEYIQSEMRRFSA